MLNGIKTRFNQLRYGEPKQKRGAFWGFALGIFLIIVIVWVALFFRPHFSLPSIALPDSVTSGWSDIKEQWNNIGGQIDQLMQSTTTETIASSTTDQGTSTENTTNSNPQ